MDTKGILYEKIDIVKNPPSLKELKSMLEFLKSQGAGFKNLFNTSGVQYRELNMSEKIKAGLSEAEALKLLSQNGKLIKRPFMITNKAGAVGFKPETIVNLI